MLDTVVAASQVKMYTFTKHSSLLLFSLLLSSFAIAQSASIQASVIDKKTKEPLIGAHVILLQNGETVSSSISDEQGLFMLKHIAQGQYQLHISYIGYTDAEQNIHVNNNQLKLAPIALSQGINLTEIQVEEQVLAVIQKEDTTQFNANAYKTLPDASAENLIEKMPTVIVENGKIQAQGEDVKQVLVDGKAFFGNDPTAALRNLPAEVIDKIQIFDQQSEQAKFTGFDDGESIKTINIITKKDMRTGEFGKLYAAYGYEDKYSLGGNVNIFNKDQRISIIGLSNNINEQNFASEDLLGVVGSSNNRSSQRGSFRPNGGGRGMGFRGQNSGASTSDFLVAQQGGISTSNALGLNYSDKWSDKIEVNGSYFFNQSDNQSDQNSNQQFFDSEGLSNTYKEQSSSNNINTNHRFTGSLNYTINDKNTLLWKPQLSWQGNNGEEFVDNQTLFHTDTLANINNTFNADLSALQFNNQLLWRHRFDKMGRTFSIRLNSRLAPQEGESYLLSQDQNTSNLADSTLIQQFSTLDAHKNSINANAIFTEALSFRSMLMLNYRISYEKEESIKNSFDFDDNSQAYSLLNTELSNTSSSDYQSHNLGLGFNYRLQSLMLMARVGASWAQQDIEQTLPFTENKTQDFFNILPMAMMRYRISKTENLRMFYRMSTQQASIEQLQDVIDNSNPLQLSIGNSNLEQAIQHHLSFNYSKTDTEKSSILYIMLNGQHSNNYIGSHTYLSANESPFATEYDFEEQAQLTQSTNLDGYWNLRSLITYGFPISSLKSNLNIDLSANFNRQPSLINDELNYANSSTTGLGLSLNSNISHRIDFNISSRLNYTSNSNSLASQNDDNYYNLNSKLKLDAIIGKGIVFRTSLNHQFYDGLSDGFDQNYLLWNMSLGKKLFKDQRGEIQLSVIDLLKQNNSLTRNITETYIEDIQTNVLQQYIMLTFKYELRNFKTS